MKSLLGLLMLVPLGAAAVDITVSRLDDPLPDGCGVGDCSLREAVLFANGAPGPDRILLPASASPYQLTRSGSAEDTGLTGDLDVIGALEIAGQGAAPVVVAQVAVDRILHLQGVGAPTTLRNVHLQGGRGVTQGGAVFAEGAQLLVVDSGFSGNVATTGGGAIGVRCTASGTNIITILGSSFEDNNARDGGAVALLPSITVNCNVSVESSEFTGNEATRIGGAIVIDETLQGSRLDIRDSVFRDNRVANTGFVTGGAVAMGASRDNSSVEDSVFFNNRAEGTVGEGGATYRVAVIARSLFVANFASRGGAVAGYNPSIEDSTLCDNEASIEGGAVYGFRAQVRRSTFCRNSALNEGGAMKFSGLVGDDVIIERSTFDANVAPSGGTIAMDDGELRLYQSTLASVDVPAPGSVGTLLRYSGQQDAANGNLVQFSGNILRGTCSFADSVATVNLAKHNAASGGNTCGLLQSGAQFTNNVTYTTLGGIPLDPLADNGGPTVTRALGTGAGHPARGRVPLAQCLDPDQRYFRNSDSSCDAGAVEMDGVLPPDAIFASGFES